MREVCRSALFVLAFSLLIGHVSANGFDQCIATIQSLPNGTEGLLDNQGNPVNITSDATAISYSLCKSHCGLDSGSFEWSIFSQQFSAWLLPWLALISQLPFGARHRSDNVMSMLLTVGSPVLGAYSLALTVLNTQWIARRFSGFKYPNVKLAVRALSSLQQVPLQISAEHGVLASVVVLPENDEWWAELMEGLDYIHTWSISAASSIAWVVIAYLFTVIDSFANVDDNINANGQGVGSVWLWLLPIVIGWLQVSPKCDFDRVAQAVEKANRKLYLAHETNPSKPILSHHKSDYTAFELKHYRRGSVHRDEESSAPIFNYARFFPWVHAVEQVAEAFECASLKARRHQPVQGDTWHIPSLASQVVHDDNRMGTLDRVEDYCTKDRNSAHGPMFGQAITNEPTEMHIDEPTKIADGDVSFMSTSSRRESSRNVAIAGDIPMFPMTAVALPTMSSYTSSMPRRRNTVTPVTERKITRWGSEVWTRVVVASVLALGLQWGTGLAAFMIVWFTPTRGLGCRSGAYLLYALVSTLVWLLMLLSSIFSHYSHLPHASGHIHLSEGFQQVVDHTSARLSVFLRRLGKFIACLNATWIVVICLFQFSSFFDRCYCDSSVIGLGSKAFYTIKLSQSDIDPLRTAWIGAIVLALGSAFAFVGAIVLVKDPPLPDP